MKELTLNEVISTYLEKGFGTMNKNDFEVWIFHYLLEHELQGKKNYEISIALKIPESKVKRLRYEAELKYSNNTSVDKYNMVCEHLKQAHFKKDGKCIQFVIEDIYLRRYLDSTLKAGGRFSDSSFNSEIVSMDFDDLEYFLCIPTDGKEEINKLLKKVQKNKNNEKLTFKELMTKMAEKLGTAAFDFTVQGILNAATIALFA